MKAGNTLQFEKQERCAIAKMTTRCALYMMSSLNVFECGESHIYMGYSSSTIYVKIKWLHNISISWLQR